MKRTIVVGDIHGCFWEFMALLGMCKYDGREDRLILLGDLIDRGPHSVKCVELAKELGAEMVRSNHEDKILRYHKHALAQEKDPTYKMPMKLTGEKAEIYAELKLKNLLDWLDEKMKTPLITLGRWTVVHGGLVPGRELGKQRLDQIIRLSYLKQDPKAEAGWDMAGLDKELKPPEGAVFWTSQWKGPGHVIHGHSVRSKDDVLVEDHGGALTVSLDTGCVYGGHLSALIFPNADYETFTIKQVRATETYGHWSKDD